MNEKKLKQLFAAARNESAPAPPPDFAADVLRAVNREPASPLAEVVSVWDHLNALFPRIALAACAIIILCLAADWGLTEAGLPGITDGATQATSQYVVDPENL